MAPVILLVHLTMAAALQHGLTVDRAEIITRLEEMEAHSQQLLAVHKDLQDQVLKLQKRPRPRQVVESGTRAVKKAAFRAVLKDNYFGKGQKAPMTILEQVGGGFDNETSIYTAPYSGWYIFNIQLFAKQVDNLLIGLRRNKKRVARSRCHGKLDHDRFTSVTCYVGLTSHVNAGDKIWMRTFAKGSFWTGVANSFFNGVLVIPDD